MLDRMRQATSGWMAKLLLGLLVVSFGIWGVANQFSGYGRGTLASVGDEEVTAVQFDRALRQRMQQFSQQMNQVMTMEQARNIGLPQQVLSQLVSEAALDDQASQYNLGVSDDKLAQEIASDPTFQGVGGRFDRQRFRTLLANAGLREEDYIADMRERMVRRQIASAIAGDVSAPKPMLDAFYRYQNEARTISYVTVDTSAIEPVGEPDDATLQAFFEDNQSQFRAPEYRSLGIIALEPSAIADPASISEEDVRKEYDSQSQRFSTPERRRVLQLRLNDPEDAKKAADEISSGKALEEVASERNLTAVDLGLKSKAEIVDQSVADAAFAADEGATVPVLDARLGPAIIKVVNVEEGSTQPFSAVEPELRKEMAERQSSNEVLALYDQIEDERAGGATLQEVAQKLNLPYQKIDAVAADGTGPDGNEISVPGGRDLIADAFQSDVGLENDPIHVGTNTFYFYDVTETTPARDRALDEVKPDVVAAWQADQRATRIRDRANALFDRLKSGTPLSEIASEIGKDVETAEGVTRTASQQPDSPLSPNAVAQAFAGPQNHVANAEGKDPQNRILLHVDSVTVPAYFEEAAGATQLRDSLGEAIAGDLLQAYNAHLINERSISVNQAIYGQIVGESQQ
ncbi:SurA N-terminal domain-containing protein [Afifella sp. H1R]|uniref:peptidylprolyl isomerase n=1 Tax=Afifella sp. H1R TaxID=2908841 RepID=UPI00351CF6C1